MKNTFMLISILYMLWISLWSYLHAHLYYIFLQLVDWWSFYDFEINNDLGITITTYIFNTTAFLGGVEVHGYFAKMTGKLTSFLLIQ